MAASINACRDALESNGLVIDSPGLAKVFVVDHSGAGPLTSERNGRADAIDLEALGSQKWESQSVRVTVGGEEFVT